jgi:ABC-2 type transport system ATP-binding protein
MMRRCSELSYGTQQRVVASAVIASDADIMILDEPTSGLDPIARRRFWAALYSLKRRGKMILITSHNPEEIESISDYIIVMSRGNIVAQGDLKSLLRSIEFKRVIEIYSEDSFINIYEEKLKTDTVYRLRNMIVSYYKDEDQADKIVDQLSRDGLKIRIRPVSVTDLLLLRGEYLYEETD